MRSTKITMIVCAGLLFCGLVAGMIFLNNGKKTGFTWNTIYGDVSAAEGLEVNGTCVTYEGLGYREKAAWELTYSVGTSGIALKSKTPYRTISSDYKYQTFSLNMTDIIRATEQRPELSEAAEKCYKMLGEAGKNGGESGTIRVRLNEVLEYYPLFGNITIGDYGSASLLGYEDENEATRKDYEDLKNFFKIPVADAHYITISTKDVVKRNEGDYFFNWVSIDQHFDDGLTFSGVKGLITPKYIFLTFNNKLADGEVVNTDQIPGGYGVYKLPYKYDTSVFGNKVHTDLCTEELCNICPLSEKANIFAVRYKEDDDTLLLFTEEECKYYMTVIDASEGRTIQKLMLADDWDNDEKNLFSHRNFFKDIKVEKDSCIIRSYSYYDNEDRVMALSKKDDGNYKIEIDLRLGEDFEENRGDFRWSAECSAAYKDGKLAFLLPAMEKGYDVLRDDKNAYMESKVNCVIVVFDRKGLTFVGEIDNTLCEANFGHYFNYHMDDTNNEPISATRPSVNYSLKWK